MDHECAATVEIEGSVMDSMDSMHTFEDDRTSAVPTVGEVADAGVHFVETSDVDQIYTVPDGVEVVGAVKSGSWTCNTNFTTYLVCFLVVL